MNAPVAWLSVVLLVAVVGPLRAEGYEESARFGDATVTLQLNKTKVAHSDDHIEMILTVEAPAPLEVTTTTPLIKPSELWLITPEKPAVKKLPGDRMRWQLRCRLEPLPNQETQLQVTPLTFRTGPANETHEQTWKSVSIGVTSTLSTAPEEASLKNLRDIGPIETVPGPAESFPYLLLGGATAVTLVIVAWIVWRWRRWAPAPLPEPTPAEWAVAELDRIDRMDLPGEQEIERFHTLVSDVLRRYLERRFGLKATEQTTPEFLQGLRTSSLLTPDQQETLRAFLVQCDLAKFARAEYTPFECKLLARTARDFVRQTAKPAPATEANGQVAATS
jgi:hypothetical protein